MRRGFQFHTGTCEGVKCPCGPCGSRIRIVESGGNSTAYCNNCMVYIKNLSRDEIERFKLDDDPVQRRGEEPLRDAAKPFADDLGMYTRADLASMFALQGLIASSQFYLDGPTDYDAIKPLVQTAHVIGEAWEKYR